ncbi:unnamed protein product [Clonostachys rhizophaga]|uniref:Major facilitator superfamily (MFS) profile domain-containing protein n=1 Tax=Clonostachys rhizophaga TaxID=160324 RepID=A0A9N9YLM4_9HYPO|nr:unnamed protein product [Clonostachys rhizophaga]
MFYFGYMAASYPMSFGFARFPIARFLGVTMVIWAIVLCCHAAASNFASLMVLRFLLGASESAISPGFSLLTGMWYAPEEHASRHAIWFSGNAIATVFGSLLAYGIGHAQSGIASWRLIFIIFGVITLAWSFVILFFLPNDPSTAKFLTEEERAFAVSRAQKAQSTSQTGQYEWSQVWEALVDPKTWLLFLYAFLGSLPNGCITNFGSIIIQGLGFNTVTTLLLNMPMAGFQLISVFGAAYAVTKIKNSRAVTVAILNAISLVGVILIRQLPSTNRVGHLIGLYLLVVFAGGFPITLSLVSSNVGGFTKRGTVTALIFVGYCAGNIAGPQLFLETEAPAYTTAFVTLLVCLCLSTADMLGLAAFFHWRNVARDKKYGAPVATEDAPAVIGARAKLDITDWKNKNYRYYP